jgi:hypothetical protein
MSAKTYTSQKGSAAARRMCKKVRRVLWFRLAAAGTRVSGARIHLGRSWLRTDRIGVLRIAISPARARVLRGRWHGSIVNWRWQGAAAHAGRGTFGWALPPGAAVGGQAAGGRHEPARRRSETSVDGRGYQVRRWSNSKAGANWSSGSVKGSCSAPVAPTAEGRGRDPCPLLQTSNLRRLRRVVAAT